MVCFRLLCLCLNERDVIVKPDPVAEVWLCADPQTLPLVSGDKARVLGQLLVKVTAASADENMSSLTPSPVSCGEITYLDLLMAAVSSSPDMLETGDNDLGLLKHTSF